MKLYSMPRQIEKYFLPSDGATENSIRVNYEWQFIASLAAQKINSRTSPDRISSPHELLFGWEYVHPSTATMVEPSTLVDTESGLADPLSAPLVKEESRRRHARRTDLLRIWDHEFEQRQHHAAERFEATIPKSSYVR